LFNTSQKKKAPEFKPCPARQSNVIRYGLKQGRFLNGNGDAISAQAALSNRKGGNAR
jgi:hypothetical protein